MNAALSPATAMTAAIGEWSTFIFSSFLVEMIILSVAYVSLQLLQPKLAASWPSRTSPCKEVEAATSDDEDATSTSPGSSEGSDASGSDEEDEEDSDDMISTTRLLSLRPTLAGPAPPSHLRAAQVGFRAGPQAIRGWGGRGGCRAVPRRLGAAAAWHPKLGSLREVDEQPSESMEEPANEGVVDVLRVCRSMTSIFEQANEEFAPPAARGGAPRARGRVFQATRQAFLEAEEELTAEVQGLLPGSIASSGLSREPRRASN